MDQFSFLNAAHTSYFADLYDQYLKYPDSVEPSWRAFFQGFDLGLEERGDIDTTQANTSNSKSASQAPDAVLKEFQVIRLIDGYRARGHLFTKTNPVRERRKYVPTLNISNFGLSEQDLDLKFNAGNIIGIGEASLRDIITHLERIYCEAIGVEYMYVRKPEEIQWIQDKLNINDNHPEFSNDQKSTFLKN